MADSFIKILFSARVRDLMVCPRIPIQAPLNCIQSTQPTRYRTENFVKRDQRSTEYITNATHRKLKNAIACKQKFISQQKPLKNVDSIFWKSVKFRINLRPTRSNFEFFALFNLHSKCWSISWSKGSKVINLAVYHRGCRNSNEIGTRSFPFLEGSGGNCKLVPTKPRKKTAERLLRKSIL